MSPMIPPDSFDEKWIQERNEIERKILAEMLKEADDLCIAKLRVIPYVLTRIGFGACLFLVAILTWFLL